MKFTSILVLVAAASPAMAFVPSIRSTPSASALFIGSDPNVELGGNTWKPKSETMGSTDTGDYFPEDYNAGDQPDFTEGMGGSPGGGGDRGPSLPGMENIAEGGYQMGGGIALATDIPEGMEFVMSSVPDGEIAMDVASNSKGAELSLQVKPVCMGFEDYYCRFTDDSHPSFSVTPNAGRMDRRGGETTDLVVSCKANGQAGTFIGNLVINLPEDNSKICYKITATAF